jgi:hypothetical protein
VHQQTRSEQAVNSAGCNGVRFCSVPLKLWHLFMGGYSNRLFGSILTGRFAITL